MKNKSSTPENGSGIGKTHVKILLRDYVGTQLMILKEIRFNLVTAMFAGLFFFPQLANAALPTAVDPTTGASGGNFVAWLTGWFGDSTESGALMISSAVFLWCAWIIVSKFNEARNAKEPDWGSFGLTAVVAGVVMVACTYILTEAVAVI